MNAHDVPLVQFSVPCSGAAGHFVQVGPHAATSVTLWHDAPPQVWNVVSQLPTPQAAAAQAPVPFATVHVIAFAIEKQPFAPFVQVPRTVALVQTASFSVVQPGALVHASGCASVGVWPASCRPPPSCGPPPPSEPDPEPEPPSPVSELDPPSEVVPELEVVALLDAELAAVLDLDVVDPEPDPELPSFGWVASRAGPWLSAIASPPPASPALGRPPLHATAPRTPTTARPACLNAFTVTIPS